MHSVPLVTEVIGLGIGYWSVANISTIYCSLNEPYVVEWSAFIQSTSYCSLTNPILFVIIVVEENND